MSGLEKIVQADTLVDILKQRASEQPDKVAYTFLVDGENHAIGFYLSPVGAESPSNCYLYSISL